MMRRVCALCMVAALLVGVGAKSNSEFVRLKAEVDLALAEGKVDKIVEPLFESTALNVASQIGYEDGVRKLLDAGADTEKRAFRGTPPIHNAAMYGHAAIVNMLIQHGAEVDALSEDGFTALTYAGYNEDDDLIKDLLAWGADKSLANPPVQQPADAEFRELLHVRFSRFEPVPMSDDDLHNLLKRGTVTMSEAFVMRLVDYAIGIGHVYKSIGFYSAHYLMSVEDDFHYDEARDTERSMLHTTSELGYMDALRKLLNDAHADPNARSADGLTPLHEAAGNGQAQAVHVLARHGADIDAVDFEGLGRTALHTAAERGDAAVVRALLARGADPTRKDESANTALDLATDKETRMLLSRDFEGCEAAEERPLKDGVFEAFDVMRNLDETEMMKEAKEVAAGKMLHMMKEKVYPGGTELDPQKFGDTIGEGLKKIREAMEMMDDPEFDAYVLSMTQQFDSTQPEKPRQRTQRRNVAEEEKKSYHAVIQGLSLALCTIFVCFPVALCAIFFESLFVALAFASTVNLIFTFVHGPTSPSVEANHFVVLAVAVVGLLYVVLRHWRTTRARAQAERATTELLRDSPLQEKKRAKGARGVARRGARPARRRDHAARAKVEKRPVPLPAAAESEPEPEPEAEPEPEPEAEPEPEPEPEPEAEQVRVKPSGPPQDYAKLRPYQLKAECRKLGARRRPCATPCRAHNARTQAAAAEPARARSRAAAGRIARRAGRAAGGRRGERRAGRHAAQRGCRRGRSVVADGG